MTPEELEERIEEIADGLSERLDKLERFMGLNDIEGPQLSQLTDEEFQAKRAASPDLPNGEDNFAIDAVQQNRIQRDLRKDVNTLDGELKALKLKVEASVSQPPPAPQPQPLPTDIQELALRLQPFFNNGTLSVGNVPGFGVGIIARTTGGHCYVIFTTDYDGAFRILPNLDPDNAHQEFAANPNAYNPRLEAEQNGVWYVGVSKPQNVSAGEHDYPNKKGKQIAIDGGDFDGNRRAGKTAKIYGGLVRRHFALGVARTSPNVLDPVSSSHRGTVYGDVIIDGDDGVNPISITVGGQNRKLVVKNVNGTEVLAPE